MTKSKGFRAPAQAQNPTKILPFKPPVARPARPKAPPKHVRPQDSVPYPASECSPDAAINSVSPPDWAFGRRPVWNNRFVLMEAFEATGVYVVEYSYWWERRGKGDRFSKQTIWFSRAGIDALAAAGWLLEAQS
jgi:hypothetical protein